MEGAKTWLSSQVADFLTQAYKNLFPDTTTASILVVTTLRSSLSMYVFFVYNNYFPLPACFVDSSLEVTFRKALVCYSMYKFPI
jgi:hypothetical protein